MKPNIDNNDKPMQLSKKDTLMNSPAHHKLHGLLFQASSRRCIVSYSKVPTYFFSNTQKSFQDKFNHLRYHDTEGRIAFLKTRPGIALKRLPLDLNSPGLLKHGGALNKQRLYRYRKQRRATLATPVIEDIVDYSKKPTTISGQYKTSKGRSQQTKFFNHTIPTSASVSPTSRWKKQGNHEEEKKRLKNPTIGKQFVQFNNFHRCFLSALNRQRNQLKKEKLRNWIKNKKSLRFIKHKNHFAENVHTLQFNKWWKSYNYYSFLIEKHIHKNILRFTKNPNLIQADLVFFTNPDRDLGLAYQVKRLGIPSIGIISGLKTSTHRHSPCQSNLHDSVTYPIVGNPESTVFILLIVQIFIRLISKVYKNEQSAKNQQYVNPNVALENIKVATKSKHSIQKKEPSLSYESKRAALKTALDSYPGHLKIVSQKKIQLFLRKAMKASK